MMRCLEMETIPRNMGSPVSCWILVGNPVSSVSLKVDVPRLPEDMFVVIWLQCKVVLCLKEFSVFLCLLVIKLYLD